MRWTGKIFNHSQKDLYVIETDSGSAKVHLLRAKMKTPLGLDADGMKKADGRSIFSHKHWWKIIPLVSVDVYQIGSDFLVPLSLMRPVPDDQFGKYEIIKDEQWGESMAYVTGLIRNHKRQVTHYQTDHFGLISKKEGVALAAEGRLDNVVVVNGSSSAFLRAKPNLIFEDNIG